MTIGKNIAFPIYNADGTTFHDLVIRNASVDSVVMSLGDKITGDVYYRGSDLTFTMQEYIEYENVKYVLVNPPTIVKEGMASDNNEAKGMTKYSFEFYHPMYMLANFPFTDVVVNNSEERYLSQNKTFSWIGKLQDFVDKLDANLATTEWKVILDSPQIVTDKRDELSEVLSFDKVSIADALKTAYDTWEVPFIISTTNDYGSTKKFVVRFGMPATEIYRNGSVTPFVFHYGKGVGLKNHSRTPRNNKIVTRIAGYGSTDNIPYGYPQIRWYGEAGAKFTYGDHAGTYEDVTIGGIHFDKVVSYPIYKGIVGGQYVELIKHPFTRNTLMPTIYVQTLFNKVSPYLQDGSENPNYNANITLVDYYDALNDGSAVYPNPINPNAPSYESHEFEKIKPELGNKQLYKDAKPIATENKEYIPWNSFIVERQKIYNKAGSNVEASAIRQYIDDSNDYASDPTTSTVSYEEKGAYNFQYSLSKVGNFIKTEYTSDNIRFSYTVLMLGKDPEEGVVWDDGNYKQGYFNVTLPILDFDLYACAAITQEMSINMRSGACIGCTFPVEVDWEDYKKNFYDEEGNFAPSGSQRDMGKYPNTMTSVVTLTVKKDIDTFGTIMPNIYQQPKRNDKFVILGISLPQSYVDNAQQRLDEDMKEYMLENNVYYYDYPLKFDEAFLAQNEDILAQLRNNAIVRFDFNGIEMALYIKQLTVKYGSKVLPEYNITLTDDIDVVLNKIGQVTDDVSRMRVQMSELQKYYGDNLANELSQKLSRIADDVALGRITFQQGLDAVGSAIFHGELRSPDFVSGMYDGKGWRIEQMGNAEFESIRARTFLEVVELLVNRLQAQEGDTMFTDNDQIELVEEIVYNGQTYYKLSLKEKWDGYVTSQQEGNILKGIINTLAANESSVSDVTEEQSVEADGENSFYTSWMTIIDPSSIGATVNTNQVVVYLWNDNQVPALKNFKPCKLMTIARWGCIGDAEDPTLTPEERESIRRRQRSFSISTYDGRITKLIGVNKPILSEHNYGTTLGVIPDFIKNWSIASKLKEGRDYLYAQGVIVGDFIKVDYQGNPLVNYVDVGEWQDNTEYLVDEYNDTTLQWETNDVWHNGAKWRCVRHQPHQGVYAEPTDENVNDWRKLLKSGDDGVMYLIDTDIESARIPSDTSTLSVSINGAFYKQEGNGNKTQTILYCYSRVLHTDGSATRGINGAFSNFSDWQPDITAGDKIEIYCWKSISDVDTTFRTYLTKKEIPVIKDGNTGAKGEIGRSFYYDGEWSSSKTYTLTNIEAPFVHHNNNYWVRVGADGSSTQDEPTNTSQYWEIMTTDFKYLITQAIFSTFANFGASIINGDWMLSQYGVIYDTNDDEHTIYNDTDSYTVGGVTYDHTNAYTLFDPLYPNKSRGGYTNFAPTFALDMKTGRTYQNIAEVMGVFRSNVNGEYSALGGGSLELGQSGTSMFSITTSGSGSNMNTHVQIGDGGRQNITIDSNRTFDGNQSATIQIGGLMTGSNIRDVVITRYGVYLINTIDQTIVKSKTWDALLS